MEYNIHIQSWPASLKKLIMFVNGILITQAFSNKIRIPGKQIEGFWDELNQYEFW